MKTTLFTIILLLSGATALQAQQLSPNFYSQFKAILTANWEDVKGKETNKEGNEDNYVIVYDSKKNLDGFKVNIYQSKDEWGESKNAMATMEKANDQAPQLFDQIITQLKKLQAEGYVLKPDADIPGAILKRISIYKGTNTEAEANISLFKTGYIEMNFYKYLSTVTTSANANSKLSFNFNNQFQDILAAKWEEVKGEKEIQNNGGNGAGMTIYNSTKTLDQFAVYAVEDNKASSRAAVATRSSNPANEQLYSELASEIKYMDSWGYFVVKAGIPTEIESKSLFLYDRDNPDLLLAKVSLFQNNEIRIIFLKGQGTAATEKK